MIVKVQCVSVRHGVASAASGSNSAAVHIRYHADAEVLDGLAIAVQQRPKTARGAIVRCEMERGDLVLERAAARP